LRSTEQGYSLPLLIRQISMPDSSSLSSLASKYPLLSRISRLRYASRYPSHRAGRCLPHILNAWRKYPTVVYVDYLTS